MPESSVQDGRFVSTKALVKHDTESELPSVALDSGIHAGMTTLIREAYVNRT
jgi:hypothetical protein